MTVGAVLAVGLGRDDLQHAAGSLDHDRVGVDAAAGGQLRLGLDHGLGGVEHQPGLLPIASGAVHLGPGLPVREGQQVPQAAGHLALAGLSRHEDERLAVAARAVRALPAEDVPHDRLLPGLQQKRPPVAPDVHDLNARAQFCNTDQSPERKRRVIRVLDRPPAAVNPSLTLGALIGAAHSRAVI